MRARCTSWLAAIILAAVSVGCAETDAGITTAVKSKMAVDADVKAYQIDVDTNNKVVTLTGTVATTTAKARAVELARGTEGVTNVVDHITVSSPIVITPTMPQPDIDRATFTDPAVTAAVKTRLAADPPLGAPCIDG